MESSKEKRINMALVAHVDSGKTTLSESMLFHSGKIRKLGRVDNKDAYLDTFDLEKERGITIFSKLAEMEWKNSKITLLDTPGHVDFSAEMERTLQVLDYAVLVISGADGIQEHTQTLWRLLLQYNIPTFLFINKMDQSGTDKEKILKIIQDKLSDRCIDFSTTLNEEELFENIAALDEDCMEEFFETGRVSRAKQREMIRKRKLFPCFWGSALKNYGVEELLDAINDLTIEKEKQKEFAAKVFKIARDEQGNRLTYMKITGGKLAVRNILSNENEKNEDYWEEKVNQIRIYSGAKFETVSEVEAGRICVATGLTKTYPGEGLGNEPASSTPILEPVLMYRVIFPEDIDVNSMIPKLRLIEEEEPELRFTWDEELKEIQVQIMGEVQIEVLQHIILDRFGIKVSFGEGNIVYKETIANVVEGVGHFEPLRHYAEVHLKMEPLETGSGLEFASECSEDVLNRNWQRLILTHLEEKEHKGVLTGASITDMRITLMTGRAHIKHTEGGDFRQATYRAVRQGLMKAQSVLLEPFYDFKLEIQTELIGRAMTDLEQRFAKLNAPELVEEGSVLSGRIPVSCMRGYQQEVINYTKGRGRITCSLAGYYPCHNTKEVMELKGYFPEKDLKNSADSVFCAHGSGFVVPWNQVEEYMHLEGMDQIEENIAEEKNSYLPKRETEKEIWLGVEEIDEILAKTYQANQKEQIKKWKKTPARRIEVSEYKPERKEQSNVQKEKYLLVDGYNIIFAWKELKELASVNIDGARGRLLDILSNYQGMQKSNLIVVFDAYRVQGHKQEIFDYHNIHVVFTKEAETADQYIEKFAHENGRKYHVTVATSDGLEQIIIQGQGCHLISAREFEKEIERVTENMRREILEKQKSEKRYLLEGMKEEELKKLRQCGEFE